MVGHSRACEDSIYLALDAAGEHDTGQPSLLLSTCASRSTAPEWQVSMMTTLRRAGEPLTRAVSCSNGIPALDSCLEGPKVAVTSERLSPS